MESKALIKDLRDLLSTLYETPGSVRIIIDDIGLKANRIDGWQSSSSTLWHNTINEARKSNLIKGLVTRVLEDYPLNPYLTQMSESDKYSARGPTFGDGLQWSGSQVELLKEKIVGGSSELLPVYFLEQGLELVKCVVRVVTPFEMGTGFIINENILVTNNHVLSAAEISEESVIQFNYQLAKSGSDRPYEEFGLDPESLFVTDKDSDLTAVRVKGKINECYGAIDVCPVAVDVGERVSIIQHPGGGSKQIALHSNHVAYSGNGVVQYLTDTLPGSSGSPVFNQDWQLVAIHHSGGWLREPGTKEVAYRNEGAAVEKLIALLEGSE